MIYKSIAVSLYLLTAVYHGGDKDYVYESYYNIFRDGKIVGHVRCSRSEKNGVTEYVTESKVKISLLVDISIYNKIESSFINGILSRGSMVRKINGKARSESHISWQNDKYMVSGVGGKSGEWHSRIEFSTGCLMHAEPDRYTKIYSENFRQLVAVEPVGPHKYAIKLPDGKDNFYTYKDGVCIEVEVPTAFATVYIRPVK
jgi:hypothetical protein